MLGSLKKYIVGMGMCKIIELIEKNDQKNWTKIVTLEKWLTMTSNWRCYGHPFITSPNLNENLTSFKHCEQLSHIHHELLRQIDKE